MLKVNKKDEPQFFTEFKRKKSPKNWDELDKPENHYIKKELKYHMLKNEQNIGDKSYCPYCEIILFSENIDLKEDKECHIEHIKPKSKFGNLTFDYRNFLKSCSDKMDRVCSNSTWICSFNCSKDTFLISIFNHRFNDEQTSHLQN